MIEGMQTIVLTQRESMRLVELMENPPPRNEVFLRAQARHRELLGSYKNEELGTVKFLLLIAVVAAAFLLFKNYF